MTSSTTSWTIDRRKNPRKERSVGHFKKRLKGPSREAFRRIISERSIKNIGEKEKVKIPKGAKGLEEPRLVHDRMRGKKGRVLPGNKEYVKGDRIPKPKGGSDRGGEGSGEGVTEDDHEFYLSREEVLDFLFDELELPNLERKELKEILNMRYRRVGVTKTGIRANLIISRTVRQSIARRKAFNRPSLEEMERLLKEIERLGREITDLEGKNVLSNGEYEKLQDLRAQRDSVKNDYEAKKHKRDVIPYIHKQDQRFRRFEEQPEPRTKAVMFCLMDISGSMQEREKDLAKRFFVLLYLFLQSKYHKDIEVVFIPHHVTAKEVNEEDFFHTKESGGTVVSSALELMGEIIQERYPIAEWNIYAAQASDGENFSGDSEKCVTILEEFLLPMCQYFAYIEIRGSNEAHLVNDPTRGGEALWKAYRKLEPEFPGSFAMKRVTEAGHIYPVFRELFEKRKEETFS